MATRPRKTLPPFAMTPLFLDEMVGWALTEAMQHVREVDELSPGQEEQVRAALETTLLEMFQGEVVGEMVKPGSYEQKIDHYSVLRTVEEMYGLSYSGSSAASLAIRNVWK